MCSGSVPGRLHVRPAYNNQSIHQIQDGIIRSNGRQQYRDAAGSDDSFHIGAVKDGCLGGPDTPGSFLVVAGQGYLGAVSVTAAHNHVPAPNP